MNTKEKLLSKIHTLIKTIWVDYPITITIPRIENWLKNFKGEVLDDKSEKLIALYLLSQFHYFGKKEIREILRIFFRELIIYPIIQRLRKDNHNTSDIGLLNKLLIVELKKAKIVGVGEPSESGNYLTYLLRQEANISTDYFINTNDIFTSTDKDALKHPNIEKYYFVDDLSGSGTTAKKYSATVIESIKKINPEIQCCYFIIFATDKAVNKVKNETLFDEVKSLYLLDKTFKCFNTNSRYFPCNIGSIKKEDAKKVIKHYGDDIHRRHPLGYKNSQLLLGLEYNIPNNTIPVIWKDKDTWYPIFKRHTKKYGSN